MTDPRQAEPSVRQLIEETLIEHGLTLHPLRRRARRPARRLIVELPGERKLTTNTLLTIGEHSVRVEAFVCRQPDENHEGVYRFLLKRNRRLYGVAYTLDNIGDIYLIGRMALDVVNAEEIDRVLGQVLEAVNNDFNTLLELGFASSIRKEWAWRVARGRVAEEPEGLRASDRRRNDAHDSTGSRPPKAQQLIRAASSVVRDFGHG